MHHWARRLVTLNCILLLSILAIASCASGCAKKTNPRLITWDLSKSRDISCLSGSKWITPRSPLYHINGDRSLRFTIILDSKRSFVFDSVNHAYVDRSGSKIVKIQVASFGYSKQGAIDRLKEMHDQWNGQGVGKIEKWTEDTEKGSLRGLDSIIHSSNETNDPNISASTHYNFGGPDDAWYIMFTFAWPDFLKPDEEEKPSVRKLKWDLSKTRELSCLSGSRLFSLDGIERHYIEGDRGLSVSILLDLARRFSFDSVCEVYVDQPDGKITNLKIVSFGYNKQDAIDRLTEMHRQWKGEGIGKIDIWASRIDQGSYGGHGTTIHHSEYADDPDIEAKIMLNTGGQKQVKPWRIETTFFWDE